MTVWLINPFDNVPQEGTRPQRYWLLARALVASGHNVIYWTSQFSHATKKNRVIDGVANDELEYEREGIRVILLPTKPYTKNISLARLLSHRALARTFRREAARANLPPPAIVLASFPPLALCDAARVLARRHRATFVCDIQDAWPETFARIVPACFLIGLRRLAKRIFRAADLILATGQDYLDLAARAGAFAPMRVINHAMEMRETPVKDIAGTHPIQLVYCGNMSVSYDLATVIRVVREEEHLTLDLAGDGPHRPYLEALANGCDRIHFHGYLSASRLAALLDSCAIGVVPLVPESFVAIPGKLADYASAHLRFVECLGGACEEIARRFRVGAHYVARDADSLKAAIAKAAALAPDWEDFREAFDAARVFPFAAREIIAATARPRRILHVCDGWERTNGAATIARHIAREQAAKGATAIACRRWVTLREMKAADDVWIHCGWKPCLWWAALLAKMMKKSVAKWMPEACYDPLRVAYHGWKKRLVGPIERFCLRQMTTLVATCPAEADWIRAYLGSRAPAIEVMDIKHFFDLPSVAPAFVRDARESRALHLLYLGRPHPLKGVRFLEAACHTLGARIELRLVSGVTGREKEKVWDWCDVLVLPTLSDNFGLVIAEALARGKRVVTTDGAPAWLNDARVTCLAGFREGTDDERIHLLTDALAHECALFEEMK